MLRLLLFITTLILTGKGASVQKDVFWREYDGSIPGDAVPTGHGLYIGQIVHKGRLIRGIINPETKTFYTQHNEQIKKTEDIKIMCSKNPDWFNWEIAEYESLTGGILKRAERSTDRDQRYDSDTSNENKRRPQWLPSKNPGKDELKEMMKKLQLEVKELRREQQEFRDESKQLKKDNRRLYEKIVVLESRMARFMRLHEVLEVRTVSP